ncbi:MAG: FAD-dependent oxidoreductase [Verrucomicrobiota bacterium]
MKASVDIAVVGAGSAGIAAAVSAARTGATTLLLDRRPAAGGIGGFSGLTTLCGLFDDAGKFLNEGFAREFAGAVSDSAPLKMGRVWVLPYRPEKFRAIAADLLAGTAHLQTRWNAPLQNVVVEGGRITSVNGIAVGAVIDCSGSAEVARAIHAPCLETNDATQAPAVVFPLHHIQREFNAPAEVAKVLLALARAGFPPMNFQAAPERGTFTFKFTGSPEQVPAVIQFLRGNVAGFENCAMPLTEFTTTARAGRMIVGQQVLTGDDVLAGRKFPDAVARGAWPIEQWNAEGVVRYRYLPAGAVYDIPARCLRAAGVENLFMAGKTISADVDAFASTRVMGCCLATGAAAAQLAARHLETLPTR